MASQKVSKYVAIFISCPRCGQPMQPCVLPKHKIVAQWQCASCFKEVDGDALVIGTPSAQK